MKNKKAVALGLDDLYAIIVIFLIILVFFFILKIKVDKMQYAVTGEQLSLDSTQLALVYAQNPVETSLGKMTFTLFMQQAIGNSEKEQELVTETKNYFQNIKQQDTAVTLAVVQNGETRVLLEPNPGFFENYIGPGWLLVQFTSFSKTYSAPSHVIIPLQNPKDYVRIEIQTIRSS